MTSTVTSCESITCADAAQWLVVACT